jgi:hypothetical protein
MMDGGVRADKGRQGAILPAVRGCWTYVDRGATRENPSLGKSEAGEEEFSPQVVPP